jgi:hypothetical protein
MARRLAVVLLACLLAGALVRTVRAGLDSLVTPGLPIPSPTDVIKVIDSLTRKESGTSIDVKLGGTVGQGKLLIARSRVNVTLERSSRNWRGRVLVHVIVPTDVTYTIDLADLRPGHIRCDQQNRLLVVAMPLPRVEAVTPILADVKTDNTFTRCRCRFFDKAEVRNLQNTILKEDYQDKARQAAAAQLPSIRQQGRAPFQVFLEKLLSTTSPGIRVLVE